MSSRVNRAGRWVRIVAAGAALLAPPAVAAAATDFEHPGSAGTAQQFTPAGPQRQDTPNDPIYDQAEPDTQQPPGNRSSNFYAERFDLFGFPSQLTPNALYAVGPRAGKPQVASTCASAGGVGCGMRFVGGFRGSANGL